MSGLVARNSAGQSGLAASKVDFQRFISSGTYTKPGDVAIIWIECYGGGGAGARANNDQGASGGGGGGAMSWACFSADALPATLDVIVGATAAGGTNGLSNQTGAVGNHSQVDIPSGATEAGKVILIAYGGGAGRNGPDENDTTGGTGGGGDGTTGGTGQTGGTNEGGGGGAGGGGDGAGGSGVVILRMATTNYSGTNSGATVTTDGSDTILTFNSSGSYTG